MKILLTVICIFCFIIYLLYPTIDSKANQSDNSHVISKMSSHVAKLKKQIVQQQKKINQLKAQIEQQQLRSNASWSASYPQDIEDYQLGNGVSDAEKNTNYEAIQRQNLNHFLMENKTSEKQEDNIHTANWKLDELMTGNLFPEFLCNDRC